VDKTIIMTMTLSMDETMEVDMTALE